MVCDVPRSPECHGNHTEQALVREKATWRAGLKSGRSARRQVLSEVGRQIAAAQKIKLSVDDNPGVETRKDPPFSVPCSLFR